MEAISKKKEFLIIFTDPHLAYSPSTLNLFYKLRETYNVELLSERQPIDFSANEVVDSGIVYMTYNWSRTVNSLIKKSVNAIWDKVFKPSKKELFLRSMFDSKTNWIISYVKNTDKEIIAVDFTALWCVQQAGKKAHLLSLEIHENNIGEHIRFDTIKSVIIQSKERLDRLFPNEKPKHFLVQNAPKNINFMPLYGERKKTDLIYCGSALPMFGVITCIDFIRDYKEYTLTLKGAFPKETEQVITEFYADLIAEKRLIIAPDYLSETELTYYVSKFRIGFAFYDFYRFSQLRSFNYYTAPSGKVFQYLNSGVPIIANYLPGFNFIADENCGKLIPHLSSMQIRLAIDAIENDYITMAENAKALSQKNNFDEMIQPFLQYLKTA